MAITELDIRSVPSPNFDHRPDDVKPDMIILHYTGMETGQAALDRMTDSDAKVSAHFMIWEDGQIDQLVDCDHRAWHAGISHWRGRDNINHYSIGIEIVNTGDEPFPTVQMNAVADLCQNLMQDYDIPVQNVIGHSDIAPGRKGDPGPMFDWAMLASKGIGIVAGKNPMDQQPCDDLINDCAQLLTEIGYNVSHIDANPAISFEPKGTHSIVSLETSISAFLLHWYQGEKQGIIDASLYNKILAIHQLMFASKSK